MNPVRIQRKRAKGWKMPPDTIYVGRPTKWGNPFTGQDAVNNFEILILSKLIDDNGKFRKRLDELKGKNLACWCPLDKPCHADILLRFANE